MPNPSTTDMGRAHEVHAAEIAGGAKTGSSGNQWDDQGDGYNGPDLPFSFRWDCKSTKGQSLSVTLAQIAKVTEESQGHRPAIPLRWYANEKLTEIAADWWAIKDTDFSELLEAARAWVELEAALGGQVTPQRVSELLANAAEQRDTIARLEQELEETRIELTGASIAEEMIGDDLDALRAKLAQAEADRDRYKAQAETRIAPGDPDEARLVPGYVPRIPWTVIHKVRSGDAWLLSGVYYDPEGRQRVFPVTEVRVERSPANRPRLMVNNTRTHDGDLYQEGRLIARTCIDTPSIEVG